MRHSHVYTHASIRVYMHVYTHVYTHVHMPVHMPAHTPVQPLPPSDLVSSLPVNPRVPVSPPPKLIDAKVDQQFYDNIRQLIQEEGAGINADRLGRKYKARCSADFYLCAAQILHTSYLSPLCFEWLIGSTSWFLCTVEKRSKWH